MIHHHSHVIDDNEMINVKIFILDVENNIIYSNFDVIYFAYNNLCVL